MPSHAAILAALSATPLLVSACMSTDSCVAAGTLVATPGGWVPVEQLRPGDPVLAVDVAGNQLVVTTITEVRQARRECLELTCGAHTLLVTPDHPIFAPAHAEFVETGRVALGQVRDVLIVDDPRAEATPRIAEIGPCRTYAGLHQVFDLSVAGPHRTFVAAGFVVHNKSYAPETTSSGDPPPFSTSEAPTTGGATTGDSTGGSTTGDSTGGSTGGTTGGGTFACGDELMCELGAEYCETGSGGIDPTISYACNPIPAECADNPTCMCLVDLLGAQMCTGEPATGVTVGFAFP